MEKVQVRKYFKELIKDQIKLIMVLLLIFPQLDAKETRSHI